MHQYDEIDVVHCHSSATEEQVSFRVNTTLPENLYLKADKGIIYCHEARQQPRPKKSPHLVYVCVYK